MKKGLIFSSLAYGVHDTPFGPCLIVTTSRGVIFFGFFDGGLPEAEDWLSTEWPKADFQRDEQVTRILLDEYLQRKNSFVIDFESLVSTPFQRKVWETMMNISFGKVISYRDLASLAGCPRAVRAVASAVASNPVSLLIPCHRVIRSDGKLGQYRWGAERKASLILWEKSCVGA